VPGGGPPPPGSCHTSSVQVVLKNVRFFGFERRSWGIAANRFLTVAARTDDDANGAATVVRFSARERFVALAQGSGFLLLFVLPFLAFPQANPPAVESALAAVKAEDTAQNRNLLGKAYEANGQTDKAVLELQEAIRKNEYEESYYFDLAYVLLQHQNFDAAIQVLESSRRIFARSAQLELALGVAYYGQRRFKEAVDSFLRTMAIEPRIGQPYIFLGRILEHADQRLPEIVARFAAQAEASPKDFMAHYLYGKALAAQGSELGKAEGALRLSIALKDDFWESHYELGLLLEKAKKFDEAAKELERSVALNPAAPPTHYRLARVYDRLGKREDAARERGLHEKLTAEEKAAMEKHASGVKRLELVIK
jgi:tetratricopeptide (TPR) repeat protein